MVIPLLVTLITGTLWIGDLILARQRLVIADRYVAWNLGNRHRDGVALATLYGEVQDTFFAPGHGSYEQVVVQSSNVEHPERWWQHAYARVTLNIQMPDWVKPWVIFGNVLWGVPEPAPLPPIAGRGEFAQKDGDSPYFSDGHAVLMRTPITEDTEYYRNWNCSDPAHLLADPENNWWRGWQEVVADPWPPDLTTRPNLYHSGGEYERFGMYVRWST